MKKLYLILIICFINLSINAQIGTSIENVYLNSQTTVSNCSTLNFGTVQNNSLVFYYKLTRPSSLPNGTGTLRIMLKYNSSSNPQMITSLNIADSNWSGTINQATISGNISESQVQLSGSTIYLEFETTGNIKTISCEYPIIKTPLPTFTLSPTTQNIVCGSTSSIIFSVSNVYNSPGTLTYYWNVGSGWSGTVNSSMSSVTLTPSSATSLPSNVTVMPYLNGVAQPTKTCIVTRSPFNPSYTLTGDAQGCLNTSSNYSINSGTDTVVWSLSNTGVASLNTTTGQNVILTGIANGSVTLNATVTNTCGQTKVFPKAILIGNPVVTNHTITGGTSTAPINTTTQLTTTYVEGATGYLWTVSNLSSNCVTTNGSPLPGVILPKFYNGLNTFTSVSPIAFVNWGNCPADMVVNCSAINACGNTGIGYRVVSVYGSGGGGGGDPCAGRMSITPNPVKEDIISINIADPIDPCGPNSTSTSTRLAVNNQVKIYDLLGNLLYSSNFNSNNFSITDLKLKKGHYALNVFSVEGYVSKKIIVVE